mgnify:CR=1 FL=1
MQTIPANQLLAGLTLAEPVAIRAVVTDSRKVEPGCVFVCFPGERVDGHDYAAGAYRSGAEYIVANHPVEGVPAERTVIVPDSGKAMIRMASNYRMLFNPRMIGVTGSVGKTTTKEFCYAVLSAFGKTLKTEGNQNNDIGVPNTLFRLTDDTEYAVVEMGMDHAGEIERLTRCARPSAGIITMIGVSHLENLGTRENILKAKLEICTGLPDGAPLAPWREKVHVLGFPTLLPRVIEPVEHDDIQCVFCGSLHPGMREPGFALALFRALHDDAVTLTMAGGGWERFEADADETARVLGAKFVRPGLLPPDEAAALENRADVLVSLGNTYDNQMPSKLFGFFATGKPVLHLAVSENDPTLPYLARYPLALVLYRKDGVTPGTVAKLHSWLHNVQGHALPFAQTARLYPEFTPEKVAEEFLKWL